MINATVTAITDMQRAIDVCRGNNTPGCAWPSAGRIADTALAVWV